MLVNSLFAFLVPIAAERGGWFWLCVIRLIQGLGEGPIVSLIVVYCVRKNNEFFEGSMHTCLARKVDST